MRLYELELVIIGHHPAKLGCHKHCGSKDVFNLSRGPAQIRDQKVIWLYEWQKITILPRLVTVGIGSGYVTVLACHVIL